MYYIIVKVNKFNIEVNINYSNLALISVVVFLVHTFVTSLKKKKKALHRLANTNFDVLRNSLATPASTELCCTSFPSITLKAMLLMLHTHTQNTST